MPREIVHWKVIQSAISVLQKTPDTNINRVLAKYPQAAYLGAISHDVPYYYRRGKDPFEVVAEYMHGRQGENTILVLKNLAAAILQCPPDRRDPLWAFLLGMLSHIAADVHFHPVVYYFTGNYNDADRGKRRFAQAHHRLFEVYLDSAARVGAKFPHGFLVRDLLISCGAADRKDICDVLEQVLVPEILWPESRASGKDRWWDGMSHLAYYQSLFFSVPVGALLRFLSLFSSRIGQLDSLTSFGRWKPEPFFAGKIEYLNPVTGSPETRTVEELMAAAVTDTVNYIRRFEACIGGSEAALEQAFAGVVGPSLNYGLPGARNEQGKYFSTNGAPLPGLKF